MKTSFLVQFQTCGLTALSKGLHHRCFSIKIVKFYRKSFSQNTAVRLLLISFNIFNRTQNTCSVVIFSGWDWLGKQKDILQKQLPGRVLQERCSRVFGKFFNKTPVQEPCFKKISYAVGLQLYLKRGPCIGFLSVKCLTLFRTDFLQYICKSLPLI